ncbi:DUF4180 domain-containing protein [Exilibacterium tricleocarpae]|uniref:DUF4180 domain-containing protein n=1 Tax=Exilibacterium tricleocarpae TaxID=2591008 RepID=A0A545SL41_9GAMM|nr:DUF4180 domain-containing protein [Exilibacterium tricleocarpae]
MTSILAKDANLQLHSEQDALDIMVSGLPACILQVDDLHPDFFDLSNGLAGAIFQKFVNYSFKVAIVLPRNHDFGPRVTELARDHRFHSCVRFFPTATEAELWLDK